MPDTVWQIDLVTLLRVVIHPRRGEADALGRLMKLGLLEKIRKGPQFMYQLSN